MAYVLLIEDEPDSAEPVAIMLRKRSHRVATALNGESAFKIILSGVRPDLIILDLRMPQMDGFQFLDVLRSFITLESTPVIVISALAPLAVEELQPYNVAAMFTKGHVDFEKLAQAVDELTASQRAN
jgi:CheY-like chemotaxis protein